MPYVALTDLHSIIPPQHLLEALDDDEDGVIDAGVWELIQAQAGTDVDGLLGQRFPVPFVAPLPALVATAARIFAAEAIHHRRGLHGDKNPFTTQANQLRSKLGRIGNGEESLTSESRRAAPSASIVAEAARTFSATGRLAT
jgi:phage gp36-like protein